MQVIPKEEIQTIIVEDAITPPSIKARYTVFDYNSIPIMEQTEDIEYQSWEQQGSQINPFDSSKIVIFRCESRYNMSEMDSAIEEAFARLENKSPTVLDNRIKMEKSVEGEMEGIVTDVRTKGGRMGSCFSNYFMNHCCYWFCMCTGYSYVVDVAWRMGSDSVTLKSVKAISRGNDLRVQNNKRDIKYCPIKILNEIKSALAV